MKFHLSFKTFIFALLLVSSAQGQWRMLSDFGAQIYSIHFLDREGYPQIGFVGLTTGEVWRTSDAGVTWQKTNIPPNLNGSIRDFSFKDSLTGWLAASQSQLNSGCYKTTDAGMTWSALSPTGQCMAIFYNPKTQALILNGWNGMVSSLTLDEGLTWTATSNNSNTCGIAFTDSLHGLMTIFPANIGGNYSSTTDGGLTWQNLTLSIEAWQPLAIKGTNTYFICAEGAREILRSNDNGKTWNVVHVFPATLDLTGDIRGDLSALYVQSKIGTFYSVDEGVTWTSYCGPHNDFDTRMYCIGEDSLYAGTLDGQLWLNPFGVKKNKQLLQFPKSPFDLVSSGCLSVDSMFRFTNLSNCLVVKLLDVQIVPGTGSKTFSFKKPLFPRILPDSGKDSLKMTYTPDNSSTDSAQLEIKYSVGGEIFDVKVWLRGFVKPGFNVVLSKDLNLLLSSDCSKLDTFVTVRSGLCGADTLLAVSLSDPSTFTITPPPLPAPIPAGGLLRIPVSVKSLPAGSYNAVITLQILSGGITRDMVINLSAIILAASDLRTNIAPDNVKFDTVSVCDIAIDTIILKNTICKNLFVKNISVQGPGTSEYAILYAGIIGSSLAKNDTAQILLRYKPTIGGSLAANLVFTIGFDLTNTRDTSIPISGIGKALAGSALESDLLAFTPIVPCTVQVLSTHLYNNSCGTDTLLSILPATDKSFMAVSPTPPVTIASGDSTLITIQEDPLSPGAKFDSVRVIIHSSSGAIDTVVLKVSGIVNQPVHKLSLVALLRLDSLAPCTQLDTILQVKNLGLCDTLTVDSIALSGPSWFSLGNLILSRKILPDSSFFVTLHFTPGAGASGIGTLHLKGIGIDTIITIQASSRRGGAPYILKTDGIIFTSSLCKPASHTFIFQNTSCDTIILDELSLKNNISAGTQFSFTPAITIPDTIAPGKKFDIIVTFDPLGIGDSTAKLKYNSKVNNFSNVSGLTGKLASSRQTAHLEMVIGANAKQTTSPAGTNITMRLLLQDDVGDTIGLKSVKTTITYFDNVLSVVNIHRQATDGLSTLPLLEREL